MQFFGIFNENVGKEIKSPLQILYKSIFPLPRPNYFPELMLVIESALKSQKLAKVSCPDLLFILKS